MRYSLGMKIPKISYPKVRQSFPIITIPRNINMFKDADKDWHPNMFDCQPYNKYKQDRNPNKLVEEQISRLPIYFTAGDIYSGGRAYPYKSKKMSKGAYEAKKRFQSTAKRRPEIIGEIQRRNPKAVFVTTRGAETHDEMGVYFGDKDTVVLRASTGQRGIHYDKQAKHELAGTAMHELEHVRQQRAYKNKPKLQKRMTKGRYEKRREEILARKAEEKSLHKHTRFDYGGRKYFWDRFREMTD